jgi:ABC-type uncharacterized transport system substrate-binding protein
MERCTTGRLLAFILSIPQTPIAVDAQGRPVRIRVLGPAEGPQFSEVTDGLQQGLRAQEYGEQTTEILEGRVTREDRTGARAAVEGFIQQRAAVLFVIGSALAQLLREVSSELLIVFIMPGDPMQATW